MGQRREAKVDGTGDGHVHKDRPWEGLYQGRRKSPDWGEDSTRRKGSRRKGGMTRGGRQSVQNTFLKTGNPPPGETGGRRIQGKENMREELNSEGKTAVEMGN